MQALGAQEVIGEVEQLVCAPPEGHAEGLDNVRARAISLSSDPTERENKQRLLFVDSKRPSPNQWMGNGAGTGVAAFAVRATRADNELLDEAVRRVIADASTPPGQAAYEQGKQQVDSDASIDERTLGLSGVGC